MPIVSIGLDYGTESCRAVIVDCESGLTISTAVSPYKHGVILERLPGSSEKIPDAHAHQHPQDWLDSAADAIRTALSSCLDAKAIGLGVAFTSCTMLPTTADGTPLAMLPEWADNPQAWPKLWKHHAAHAATEVINEAATRLGEAWHARYGYAGKKTLQHNRDTGTAMPVRRAEHG